MDKSKKRNEVFTRIVKMLESEGTFLEIVNSILEECESYINTTNAAIMQISADNTMVNTVISYKRPYEKGLEISAMSKDDFAVGTDKLCYVTANDCNSKQRLAMDKLGILTSVTVPLYINDVLAMYVALFDTAQCLNFSQDDIAFIENVARIIQTIAQKKVTKNSLLSSYEILREILSSIGTGIMVFGRADKTIYFENDIARNTDEVRRTIKKAMVDYFENINNPSFDKKKPVEHYDSQSGLWFELKYSDLNWIDGNEVVVVTAMDITQKKKNQQKIEYQANNDFLTGLYNRMKCEADLRDIIKNSIVDRSKGAVLFIDLDDFKTINDGLGHQYGDILLQQIAAGLQGIKGLRGHCYRMGGDEFVVIIPPESFGEIEKLTKNIMAMFNKPWYLMGTEYYCTMSMGVAIYPDNSADVHEVIKMADIAMYDSKKTGKNRCSFYDDSKSSNTSKRLDIENNMRQAIASQIREFVVFYQPVVDTFSNKCVSCEALVRWNSKVLGFMGPGEFIPLAEYLGLITDIGDYVLEEACKQCKIWNDTIDPDFHINVNLSVVQLLQKNVVENIAEILKRTGVNSKNIILEITESFAINDMERVLKIIDGLKKLGPRIALDDFGTGYSSLNYIKQLHLNLIKVDKTFIDDITDDEYAQAFIRLIVELSKTIGTRIVVEGVEQKEQYELLRNLGVNFIQGYYFGKPVPSDEFEKKYLGKVL